MTNCVTVLMLLSYIPRNIYCISRHVLYVGMLCMIRERCFLKLLLLHMQTEEQLFDHENDESHTEKDFDSTLNEREEKRKRFFEQQERKLRDKQRHLRYM